MLSTNGKLIVVACVLFVGAYLLFGYVDRSLRLRYSQLEEYQHSGYLNGFFRWDESRPSHPPKAPVVQDMMRFDGKTFSLMATQKPLDCTFTLGGGGGCSSYGWVSELRVDSPREYFSIGSSEPKKNLELPYSFRKTNYADVVAIVGGPTKTGKFHRNGFSRAFFNLKTHALIGVYDRYDDDAGAPFEGIEVWSVDGEKERAVRDISVSVHDECVNPQDRGRRTLEEYCASSPQPAATGVWSNSIHYNFPPYAFTFDAPIPLKRTLVNDKVSYLPQLPVRALGVDRDVTKLYFGVGSEVYAIDVQGKYSHVTQPVDLVQATDKKP